VAVKAKVAATRGHGPANPAQPTVTAV